MSQTNEPTDKPPKVEIFKVVDLLKNKLGMRPPQFKDEPGHIDPKAIKEADSYVDKLREECPDAIAGYLDEIMDLWGRMQDMPRSQEREDISKRIHILAHEVKDLSEISGYMLAAYFAESLRDYITQTQMELDAQRVIIQAHIDVMQIVQAQGIKDDAGPQADELKKLVQVAIKKYS